MASVSLSKISRTLYLQLKILSKFSLEPYWIMSRVIPDFEYDWYFKLNLFKFLQKKKKKKKKKNRKRTFTVLIFFFRKIWRGLANTLKDINWIISTVITDFEYDWYFWLNLFKFLQKKKNKKKIKDREGTFTVFWFFFFFLPKNLKGACKHFISRVISNFEYDWYFKLNLFKFLHKKIQRP